MRGLTLEGGGMRGLYSEGIFDIFLEKGIDFSVLVGVSAGALLGVNYISKQPERGLRYNSEYMNDKRYSGLKFLITTGNLFNTEFAYYELPTKLDVFDNEEYKKSDKRLWSEAIDIETGEAVFTRIDDVFAQMEYLRASGSLPFISKPVEVDGRKCLDGGMAESIPIDYTFKLGCDKVVVILTRQAGYEKKPEGRMMKLFTKIKYRKYPKLAEALLTRSSRYNSYLKEIEKMEKEGKIFVFRPSVPIEIDRLEKSPEKLREVYELGKKDGLAGLDKMLEYLNAE